MKELLSFLSIMLIVTSLKAQTVGDAVVGKWLTQEKDGIVEIFKQNNKYFGKIVWGKNGNRKDTKNPDPKLRNRDVIGLVILTNFSYNGKGGWTDGEIYDPQKGKTYSCNMKIVDGKLEVRGYIGISLLGRTAVWTRTN
jgi:uncharacterized protein (DUF2147 family)